MIRSVVNKIGRRSGIIVSWTVSRKSTYVLKLGDGASVITVLRRQSTGSQYAFNNCCMSQTYFRGNVHA